MNKKKQSFLYYFQQLISILVNISSRCAFWKTRTSYETSKKQELSHRPKMNMSHLVQCTDHWRPLTFSKCSYNTLQITLENVMTIHTKKRSRPLDLRCHLTENAGLTEIFFFSSPCLHKSMNAIIFPCLLHIFFSTKY